MSLDPEPGTPPTIAPERTSDRPRSSEPPGEAKRAREAIDARLAEAARLGEQVVTTHLMRRVVAIFGALWVASFVADALVLWTWRSTPVEVLLGARALPLPVVALILHGTSGEKRLSQRRAHLYLLALDVTSAVWLSYLALLYRGIDSPMQAMVMFVPLSLAVVPFPWRLGLVRHLVLNATYLTTMLVGFYGLGIEPFRREVWVLVDPKLFVVLAMMTHAMSASLVAVSHTIWSLRREVFTQKHVGRYELRRMLGKGGMGEVWVAWHAQLRREVALKLVRVDGPHAKDAALRFEREITAMTKLSHPNTVRIYDFGADEGGILYCAMELLDGENLGALVRREGALETTRTTRLLFQAASALAEAHSIGIVHRDIKPENLFVVRIAGGREVLKVLDFGIVAIVDDDGRITERDVIAGTPATMSPEIIRGESATPASDVYALGCVAYHVLTGAMPFGASRAMGVLDGHLHHAPVPPSLRSREPVPDALEALVLRCLAKDPHDRFADAGELASALAELEGHVLPPRAPAADPPAITVAPTLTSMRARAEEARIGDTTPPM